MSTFSAPVCMVCRHYRGDRKCSAFKEQEIPDRIWTGDSDHTRAIKGDNGVRFEPSDAPITSPR
jgi:hypothetical protein